MCCTINIIYAKPTQKRIAGKQCTLNLIAKNVFLLTSGCDTVLISSEAKLIHERLTPVQIFAQSAIQISVYSLACGILCIMKRLTLITIYVLTTKRESQFDACFGFN
jgi:hypothetical protein